MVKQQAQDHASARSLNTLLLGQIAPSFMSLPVLKKNLNSNPTTSQIVTAIQEKKGQAHADLLCHLSSLFKDGATCLRQIKSHIPSSEAELRTQVKHLLETSIDAHKIADPFLS